MTRRMFSSRVAASTTIAFMVAGGLMACDSGEETEDGIFYCTDANGVVVAEELCDDESSGGGGAYFFGYVGSSLHTSGGHSGPYKPGQQLPKGHQKFAYNDKTARAKFGLKPTGKIANGTVKTGVIGKGGPGSTAVKGGGGSGGRGSGGG